MTEYRTSHRDSAVSPVVGVMLMLIVTILIAAVVSAFAGGMAKSQDKPAQLTLEGTYSIANGMTITHGGGDPVALTSVMFMTTPSDLFGADAAKFAYPIDKSILTNSNGQPILNNNTGFYNTSGFVAGDTLLIDQAHCMDYTDNSSGTVFSYPWTTYGVNANARVNWAGTGKDKYFGAYTFSNPANVGKYFYLDIVDSKGTIITRAKVTITA
jgi:hypothetical protein